MDVMEKSSSEKRLIDAHAVDYENIMCSQSQLHWLNTIIEKQPTVDAVTVVRCEYCKKGHPELAMSGCVWCVRDNRDMNTDDFCSYGERKEGAGG